MSSVNPYRAVTPSFSTFMNAADGATSPVSAQRTENGAMIRWTLPASVAFSGEAEATLDLHVEGKDAVPIRLKLTDGPTVQVVYADRTPPQDFANFRVFVSGPALQRTELGGSTDQSGFFSFQTMPLGTRWQAQAGEMLFEVTGV